MHRYDLVLVGMKWTVRLGAKTGYGSECINASARLVKGAWSPGGICFLLKESRLLHLYIVLIDPTACAPRYCLFCRTRILSEQECSNSTIRDRLYGLVSARPDYCLDCVRDALSLDEPGAAAAHAHHVSVDVK